MDNKLGPLKTVGYSVGFGAGSDYLIASAYEKEGIYAYKREGAEFAHLLGFAGSQTNKAVKVAVSKTGNVVAALYSGDPYAQIYRRSGDDFILIGPILGLSYTNTDIAISNDEEYIYILTYYDLWVFQKYGTHYTKIKTITLPVPGTRVPTNVSVSPDNSYVAIGFNGSSPRLMVFKWDGSTFAQVTIPGIPTTGTTADAAFSPTGDHLIWTNGTEIHTWKIANGIFSKIIAFDTAPDQMNMRYVITSDNGNYVGFVRARGEEALLMYHRNGDTYTRVPLANKPEGFGLVDAALSWDGDFLAIAPDGMNYIYLMRANVSVRAYDHRPASGGFVDRKINNTFAWSLTPPNDYPLLIEQRQKAAKFRWRAAGDTTYTEIYVPDGTMHCEVPANTITTAGIEWQVQVQSEHGDWSTTTEWQTLTTIDSLSEAKPISPVSAYINAQESNLFQWEHIIDTGSPPHKSELQYSTNNLTWANFASVNGPQTQVTVPANTLPAGRIWWRVRTYNTDDVAGQWSEGAAIVTKGAPLAPVITDITNSARPLIKWQSLGQISYEIKITVAGETVYEIKETASATKAHQVEEYLDDGQYVVHVRIKNADLIFSEWSTGALTISTIKPTPPTIKASAVKDGIMITLDSVDGALKMYLFRDHVPIAKITGDYYDYTANGTHNYAVRVVSNDDSFADSNQTFATLKIDGYVFAPHDNPMEMIRCKILRDSPPTLPGTKQIQYAIQHYAGRKYPVCAFSQFTNDSATPQYSFLHVADWNKMQDLIEARKTVVYRDMYGNTKYWVITGATYTQSKLSVDFSLSVETVDYNQKIRYDLPGV